MEGTIEGGEIEARAGDWLKDNVEKTYYRLRKQLRTTMLKTTGVSLGTVLASFAALLFLQQYLPGHLTVTAGLSGVGAIALFGLLWTRGVKNAPTKDAPIAAGLTSLAIGSAFAVAVYGGLILADLCQQQALNNFWAAVAFAALPATVIYLAPGRTYLMLAKLSFRSEVFAYAAIAYRETRIEELQNQQKEVQARRAEIEKELEASRQRAEAIKAKLAEKLGVDEVTDDILKALDK